MIEPDYRGLAALVIAISLGTGWVAGLIGVAVMGREIGDKGGDVLIAIGGAMIGALAGYMGGRYVGPKNGEKP